MGGVAARLPMDKAGWKAAHQFDMLDTCDDEEKQSERDDSGTASLW